jgi:hypothetical protein
MKQYKDRLHRYLCEIELTEASLETNVSFHNNYDYIFFFGCNYRHYDYIYITRSKKKERNEIKR